MIYVTVPASPHYKQLSIDDLLFGDINETGLITSNEGGTFTYVRETTPNKLYQSFNTYEAWGSLRQFLKLFEDLYEVPRESLYETFYIPKKSGGLRRIDAPKDSLKCALTKLKELFEEFGASHHTSAFAYVKNRCTVDAVRRHQANNSKWFAKFDLHGFFPSTDKVFVMSMLEMIYPFNLLIGYDRKTFEKVIDLCFLNGGLPQGTPFSPMITNLIMIPIDFALANKLKDYENQRFVYTRYADDFIISSRYNFKYKEIEELIVNILEEFKAPFELNKTKTRYGNSNGRNWNLGVMLNKDNEITVGYKNKKRLQSMMFSYAKDRISGIRWDLGDIQTMEGLIAYYTMVEGDKITAIVNHTSQKVGFDIKSAIREDISGFSKA